MLFKNEKYYTNNDSSIDVTIKQIAKDYKVSIPKKYFTDGEYDTIFTTLEKAILKKSIEYHVHWSYDLDRNKIEFFVFRILLQDIKELIRYNQIILEYID